MKCLKKFWTAFEKMLERLVFVVFKPKPADKIAVTETALNHRNINKTTES